MSKYINAWHEHTSVNERGVRPENAIGQRPRSIALGRISPSSLNSYLPLPRRVVHGLESPLVLGRQQLRHRFLLLLFLFVLILSYEERALKRTPQIHRQIHSHTQPLPTRITEERCWCARIASNCGTSPSSAAEKRVPGGMLIEESDVRTCRECGSIDGATWMELGTRPKLHSSHLGTIGAASPMPPTRPCPALTPAPPPAARLATGRAAPGTVEGGWGRERGTGHVTLTYTTLTSIYHQDHTNTHTRTHRHT